MSVTLNIESAKKAKEDEILHLMPCKIDYDGEAKVASYFTTSIRHDEANTQGERYLKCNSI